MPHDVDHAHLDDLTRRTLTWAAPVLADPVAAGALGTDHRATQRAVTALAVLDLRAAAGAAAPDAARAATALRLVAHLERLQGATGLFDGDNLASPPDSSFTLNDLCRTVALLDAARPGAGPSWGPLRERLVAVARRALPALLVGGVHTPNHRWELASALAACGRLLDEPAALARARRWLAEGVDQDAEGIYSERSPNYAAWVSNPTLLHLAHDLDDPSLLEPVRRNLQALVGLTDADGRVETSISRRQDQDAVFPVSPFGSQLRRFAVEQADPELARLARLAFAGEVEEPAGHLAEALGCPPVRQVLPEAADDRPDRARRTVLHGAGLVRWRRGGTRWSVFGGSDRWRTGRVASGLASSASVLQVRHGAAELRAVRWAPHFFDTGALRPDRLEVDGPVVSVHERRTGAYYGPLDPALHDPDGVYAMSDEGRFFARMDFGARPAQTLELRTTVRVRPDDDGLEALAAWDGPVVPTVLELVVPHGTAVSGVRPHPGRAGVLVCAGGPLRIGTGAEVLVVEVVGADGGGEPDFPSGELFTAVGGEDVLDGVRVWCAGRSDRPLGVRVSWSHD